MAEDWEVAFERMHGDIQLLRSDLRSYIDRREAVRKAEKPDKDRAKMLDLAVRVGVTGLLALEGLDRVDIGSSTVPTVSSGVSNGVMTLVALALAVF